MGKKSKQKSNCAPRSKPSKILPDNSPYAKLLQLIFRWVEYQTCIGPKAPAIWQDSMIRWGKPYVVRHQGRDQICVSVLPLLGGAIPFTCAKGRSADYTPWGMEFGQAIMCLSAESMAAVVVAAMAHAGWSTGQIASVLAELGLNLSLNRKNHVVSDLARLQAVWNHRRRGMYACE